MSLAAHVSAVCRSGYHQLRQLRPVVGSLSADASKTLIHAFISSRLDYCNSLLYGILSIVYSTEEAAVDPKCSRTTDHRNATARSHYASVTTIALATSPRKDRIQGRLSRLQIAGRSGAAILKWWLSSHFRVTPVCRLQNLHCTKNIQPFRWQKFLCFWSTSVEHTTQRPPTSWHKLRTFQTAAENFSIQRSRRIVTGDFLYLRLVNTFTYLITYLVLYIWNSSNLQH